MNWRRSAGHVIRQPRRLDSGYRPDAGQPDVPGTRIGWHLFLDSVLTYTAMTRLNLTIGRAAGMIFGYASGLGHAQVVPLNTLVQTIQVLVVYPLFVLSSRQLIRVPRLQFFLTRMQRAAETHDGTVRKFGIVGCSSSCSSRSG